VGLAALGWGCARAPVAPRPAVVYVDAERLAREHPSWSSVAELDRRIAWLSAYRASPVASPRQAVVDTDVDLPEAARVDMEALTRRLQSTLEEIRARQRRVLERELERERRQEQATDIQAERGRIEAEAERRFQAVLDARGAEMANILVRLTAVTILEQSYAARGKSWEELAAEMRERRIALNSEFVETRERRTQEVEAVFTWLQQEFARAAAQEEQNALEWIRTHGQRLEELNRNIDAQKLMLLNALRSTVLPSVAATAVGSPAPSAVAAETGAPALPGPGLEDNIAQLRARRERLARFAVQNTKAVVKAAARSFADPMEPVFERTTTERPDRTALFRPIVSAPAREVPRLTEHGDL